MVSSPEAYTSIPLGGKKVILYDLKGRDGRPWNPNATKARAVLNLKKIPYETVFLDFLEIEAKSKELGLAPATGNATFWQPCYTVPIISVPSTRDDSDPPTVIRDSMAISEYLDDRWPSKPSLFLKDTSAESNLITRFDRAWMSTISPALARIAVESTTKHLTTEQGAVYYIKSRKEGMGMDIENLRESTGGMEAALQTLKQGMVLLMNEFPPASVDSKFWFGDHVSYPDIIVGSFLFWVYRADEKSKEGFFETLLDITPDRRLRKIWGGVKEYVMG